MGCFLACFGCDDGKRRKSRKRTSPLDHSNKRYASLQPTCSKQIDTENEVSSVLESRGKVEAGLSFNSKKKVTFDLDVKTFDAEVSTEEKVEIYSSETNADERREIEEKNAGETNPHSASSQDNSTSSSTESYPSNHRYENCVSSDDEVEYEDSDFDDDDEYDDDAADDDDNNEVDGIEGEESFDPYSAVPRNEENRVHKEHIYGGSPYQKPALLDGNVSVRDRSQYTNSVLNPVENLSQWKAVKARAMKPLKYQEEENFDLEEELHIPFSAEPTFKSPKSQKSINSSPNITGPSPNQEISVDASLSNWLDSTENTPSTKSSMLQTELSENSNSQRSCLSRNHEDRPILGALTIEELKQLLSSSSPRRSPSRSPDEIPIVGSVGSYWNHSNVAVNSGSSLRSGSDSKGIPNTTNKYREEKRVNWNSTPFEVKLERALKEAAAAEV